MSAPAVGVPVTPEVATATESVPETHYTHHDGRGPTVHRTNPLFVHRDISHLDVKEGMNVLEIGTGSGYSGALLSELVGTAGSVTSVDIDGYLTRWANLIHHRRGLVNIRCHTTDGTTGYPHGGPYDRIGAWCSPPLLPKVWVDQSAEGGRIVSTLPIAPIPDLTVLAIMTVTDGRPGVEAITSGNYIDATPSPKVDLDLPGRWIDWEVRHPEHSWVSIAWRKHDDWHHSGARTTLERLVHPAHTEPASAKTAWKPLQYWAAATADPGLSLARLAGEMAFGHSTPTSAAALTKDGRLIADAPDSPSLDVLRGWIAGWHAAGRPTRDDYTPTLESADGPDGAGWNLRLTR
ncbi:protein-L-isoaspartate O-methyltransferase family protein [Streptomyces alkaliphilus]|uniref:protein-L-isoaspartate O-methyltransferase family protein n=1 Tax=Streptomyces alkaliphilus TaxID=1472722 RepID=UPI00117C6D7E|nr:protein-L-isoaspartate(D-aspartate) O-methyltransferase [Streptomyces alkaliphilus]MQS06326.1 protein-L-isoaspartate(D-aspartate) O-methyltransferase [Streptomyces alkaliphilus]